MAVTLTPDQIASIAADHERARRTVTPIDPVTRQHPDMTLDDAYAIQAAWIGIQVAAGAVVRGHKIGLTSRAMQMAMQIDEPDFGALLDHMFVTDGATLRTADYLDPKVEVEFAFVLDRALVAGEEVGEVTGEFTADDVYAATSHIVPAIELIDARSHRVHPIDGRPRTVIDTISDNAANAAIVVGGGSVSVADAHAGRLRWAGAICARNGIVEETGLGAGVLGDPVVGVVWLANRLRGLGIPLEAGQTILAGSFTRPIDCRVGDHIEADFGDLGVITLDFT